MAPSSAAASPIVASDDFVESAAWTAETEISANEVVEKEKLVRCVAYSISTQQLPRSFLFFLSDRCADLHYINNVRTEISLRCKMDYVHSLHAFKVSKTIAAKPRLTMRCCRHT